MSEGTRVRNVLRGDTEIAARERYARGGFGKVGSAVALRRLKDYLARLRSQGGYR